MIKPGLFSSLITCCLIMFASCTTYKNIPYFQDFPENDTSKPLFIKSVPFKSPVIEPDDILIITMEAEDNTVSSLINSNSNSTESAVPGQAAPNGYTVDKDGYVKLKFLGKIKVAGLTTNEATNLIETEATKQFNNVTVKVKFGNFKVTVLGEVAHPATFVMPNEKVNIFDVLGMAGDLTIFGKRESVLLLRDSNSVEGKKAIRINLNSKNIVASPYFFLKPDDIVYIPPNQNKFTASNVTLTRNIGYGLTVISLATLILYRFF